MCGLIQCSCRLLNQGDEQGPWKDQRAITERSLRKGQSSIEPELTPYSFTWHINSHLNGRKLLEWLIHWAYEIVIVVSHVHVRGCEIEEMCGGIMRPITEMGCKYGRDRHGPDVRLAHFIWDCSAEAKWQAGVSHWTKGKVNLTSTVHVGLFLLLMRWIELQLRPHFLHSLFVL